MLFARLFNSKQQPLEIINRCVHALYYCILLLLCITIGFSPKTIMLFTLLLGLHAGNQKLSRYDAKPGAINYILLIAEFICLILLSIRVEGELAGTIFLLYTANIMLNYPAYTAFPWVYSGYLIYLVVFNTDNSGSHSYFFSLLNFSILPISLFAIRVLIDQQQRILDLNKHLQSQAALSAEMAKLRERTSLAEAMHDTIGHRLTASIVSLEGVSLLLKKRPSEAIELLDTVREQLQEGLGDIRKLVHTLKTDGLDEHTSLRESLSILVARIQAQTFVDIDVLYAIDTALLPIQEYVLYSILREGITNALKHGQARYIRIKLEEPGQDCVALSIEDNGIGAHHFSMGFGLNHLKQKVEALGGSISVETQAHAGFIIYVLMPLALERFHD